METIRILLVDDDYTVGTLAKDLFEKYHAHRGGQEELDLVFVETGQTAVERLEAGLKVDLILMDYQVPPGNEGGVWATKKIKEFAPDIPVIFLSAYTGSQKVDKAQQAGALGYIAKTIFTQMAVVECLIDRDWVALQEYVDKREVWLFSPNAPRPTNGASSLADASSFASFRFSSSACVG